VACVRLDTHRENTVFLFSVLLGLLPGYLLAMLIGLTKNSWLLVSQRQVIFTRLSRREYSGLRHDVLRLDRPVHLELSAKNKVVLPAEIAAFLHRRVMVVEDPKAAREAFELAGTPASDEPAEVRDVQYAGWHREANTA
jgi:hypothetical protein